MLTFLVLFILPIRVSGQYAMVKQINAETAEGLLINVWVERQTVKVGQDIVIHYKIENGSAKTLYLIHQDVPDIMAERATIRVGAPLPSPDSHGGYDYSFTKIERGKSHQGRLIVSGDKYDEVRPWFIEVGFAYVTNVTGLNRRLRSNEDPVVLRGALFSRAVTLLLGGLTVNVVET